MNEAFPVSIPIVTITFIIGASFYNYSLWPIFSYVTPFLTFTHFMGFICLLSFIPELPGKSKSAKKLKKQE